MPVAPPKPKSLPLNALKAFEAAARLGGFASAADELGVSPGAISAHIKALEEELGAPLFERGARGVRLTALALQVVDQMTDAFDTLGQVTQTLRAEAAPNVVHIVTLPSIAQLWLSPRLPEIRAQFPGVEISITAMETPPNLKRTPYDLCLFYADDRGETLAEDLIFPVCAPSLAPDLLHPNDFKKHTCLRDTTWTTDWDIWSAAAMPDTPFAPDGPVFSLYALAVEETINGAGVLMGHAALVERFLSTGALVAPFPQKIPLPRSLRLWSARSLRATSPAGRVADHLKRMAACSQPS